MGEQTKMPGTSEQRESVDAQQGIVQVPNQTRDKDSSREMTALPSPLPPSQVLVGRTREPVAIEEDAYVSSLSAIIQRDFFPDLAKMRLQKDLDAVLLALDFRRAQELNAQLSALSAKGSATAEPAADGTDKNIDTNLSLDAFQSRFTSEDNASFNQIVAKANEAKREQFAWMYEHEKQQQQARLLQGSAQASALRITASSESAQGQTDSLEMILKDEPSSQDSLEPAIRSMNSTTVSLETVKIDSWKYKARNALIFEPQGAPLTMADLAQSKGPQKTISHSATRFADAPSLEVTRTDGQAASSLTRLATQEVWRTMAQNTPSLFPGPSSTPGKFDSTTGEYSFVESTPLLVPGESFDPSELMTWGYIEGTPILVDQNPSATPKQFKIPPTPKRDALGLRLAESVGKKSVAARSMRSGSDTLASLSQRTLSPAAHRLLSRSSLGKAVGSMGHTSGAIASSTPIPTTNRTGTTPIILGRTDSQLRASYASSTPGRGVGSVVSRSTLRAPGSSSRPTSTTSAMRTNTVGDGKGTATTPIRPSSHVSNISVAATRLESQDTSSDKKDLTDNLLRLS